MDTLQASSPDFLDIGCRPSGTTAPTLLSRRMNPRRNVSGLSLVNGSPLTTDSPRKFTIGAFLPLPSISASPVCTPTSSISPQDSLSDDSTTKSLEQYTTAPSSPSGVLLGISSPPTWISTPPTPPPKMVRRSITCITRPASPISPSASYPAPALPHENSYFFKRCNSVPSNSRRLFFDAFPRSRTYSRRSSADNTPTFPGTTSDRHTPSRSKPLFHIQTQDTCMDTEDSSPRLTESPERMNEELASVESDVDSDDSRSEKAKDDIRKYYALKEVLDTEVGYLLDLRALVTVYLRIIPTLISRPSSTTTFARASSSFVSSPWVNSYSHIQAAAVSASGAVSESSGSTSPNSSQLKEPHKSSPRYLFTNQEVEILTRNAEEILQLHEQFVRELRLEMAPLGFSMEAYPRSDDSASAQSQAVQNTDAAIRVVSAKFATEASRFASYQAFCAGHPEALDLVRKTVSQRPSEWDAFEQRCSSLVSELELYTAADLDSSEATPSSAPSSEGAPLDSTLPNVGPSKDRSRAASLSSIEGAVRILRSRASNIPSRDGVAASVVESRKERMAPRLAFTDYVIKPIQRICKYPLILEQLKSSQSVRALFPAHPRSDLDVIVESATQAMRHVASAVDEARHRQDVAIQSALIASRISCTSPALSQMSALFPAFQAMTQTFLSSLGTCLLAGSLDVIHHSPKFSGSSVVAKYYGAFLYIGGYLILAKVSKGKVYEPRHWFSLADFDVCDADEADAMLPCSIRLTSKEHWFELAAACQREKDAWLSSIQESCTHQPSWINEPTPSLRFDGKGDLIPHSPDDGAFEVVNVLPTIQSIPELAKNSEYPGLAESLINAFGPDLKQRRSPRQEFLWRQDSDLPSRRSSTASAKGIFSPVMTGPESIVIRRYSASARSKVDHGLQDIVSQLCLTARSYASIKDEELFPAPKVGRGAFVRSQSGLSMASMAAKSRLTRHESVRVLRRRSLVDKLDTPSSKKSSSSGQSLSSRRQSKALSITAVPESDQRKPLSTHSSTVAPPSFMSTPQSPKSPSRSSIFFNPTPTKPTSTPEPKSPMKTSRSLVNGVKELFQSRSSSTLSLGNTRTPDTEIPASTKRTPGSIRRWAKGSLHRRTRSAPDVPEEPSTLPDIHKLPALDLPPFDLPGLDFGTPISLTSSPESFDLPQKSGTPSSDKGSRRTSLLSSPDNCQSTTYKDNHGPSKHLSILRRLKP